MFKLRMYSFENEEVAFDEFDPFPTRESANTMATEIMDDFADDWSDAGESVCTQIRQIISETWKLDRVWSSEQFALCLLSAG